MKPHKFVLTLAVAAGLVFALSGPSVAFHDGGVAHCDGCHTMHNSIEGVTQNPNPTSNLLVASDPSSVCLTCHSGPLEEEAFSVLSDDASIFSPGGDFRWITIDIFYTTFRPMESRGEQHGHNIQAVDFGLTTIDTTPGNAPGGSFLSADLSCTSCHDPHGNKFPKTAPIEGSGSFGNVGEGRGNYRLLGDPPYTPVPGFAFTEQPPFAVAPGFFGPTGINETDTNHTDYGSGMSEWCGNCHGEFVVGINNTKHPAGADARLGAEFSRNYNRYVSTGELVAPNPANKYLALVPFSRGTPTGSVEGLNASNTSGPNGNATVSCMTCHRAHASAFRYATRWDMTEEFLANSHPGPRHEEFDETNSAGIDPAVLAQNAYGPGRDIIAEFGPLQRSLCNKCHIQD